MKESSNNISSSASGTPGPRLERLPEAGRFATSGRGGGCGCPVAAAAAAATASEAAAAALRAAEAAAMAEPRAGLLPPCDLPPSGADGGRCCTAGTKGGRDNPDVVLRRMPRRFRAGKCRRSHHGRPSFAAVASAADAAAFATSAALKPAVPGNVRLRDADVGRDAERWTFGRDPCVRRRGLACDGTCCEAYSGTSCPTSLSSPPLRASSEPAASPS
mmetsp:Transcript_75119/g.244192  ORF Transcript_75119/g.244192 Transcript_75119/m.244192 type:complete len:217 (-) Transcript_75119:405-1055(-)